MGRTHTHTQTHTAAVLSYIDDDGVVGRGHASFLWRPPTSSGCQGCRQSLRYRLYLFSRVIHDQSSQSRKKLISRFWACFFKCTRHTHSSSSRSRLYDKTERDKHTPHTGGSIGLHEAWPARLLVGTLAVARPDRYLNSLSIFIHESRRVFRGPFDGSRRYTEIGGGIAVRGFQPGPALFSLGPNDVSR